MPGHKRPESLAPLILEIQFKCQKQNVSFDRQGENLEENQKTDFLSWVKLMQNKL